MREFEKAFRAWLEAVASNPNGRHQPEQCALVEILSKLKNVYDVGRLSSETRVAEPPIILGQSILDKG
jgi:hypothetical protein